MDATMYSFMEQYGKYLTYISCSSFYLRCIFKEIENQILTDLYYSTFCFNCQYRKIK